MDNLFSRSSAQRRRVDGPVNSQLHRSSITVPNAEAIFPPGPVSRGNNLDTVEVLGSITSTVHPNQRCNSHPSQHCPHLPPFTNGIHVLLSDYTNRNDSAPLHNNALDTGSYLNFESFQYQNSTDDYNAVANDVSVNDDITVICYGMVSILLLT